jgi:hypothetical protein
MSDAWSHPAVSYSNILYFELKNTCRTRGGRGSGVQAKIVAQADRVYISVVQAYKLKSWPRRTECILAWFRRTVKLTPFYLLLE